MAKESQENLRVTHRCEQCWGCFVDSYVKLIKGATSERFQFNHHPVVVETRPFLSPCGMRMVWLNRRCALAHPDNRNGPSQRRRPSCRPSEIQGTLVIIIIITLPYSYWARLQTRDSTGRRPPCRTSQCPGCFNHKAASYFRQMTGLSPPPLHHAWILPVPLQQSFSGESRCGADVVGC